MCSIPRQIHQINRTSCDRSRAIQTRKENPEYLHIPRFLMTQLFQYRFGGADDVFTYEASEEEKKSIMSVSINRIFTHTHTC